MAPQHDHDQESHHLASQLRVSEAMIMAATRRIDDMHVVMADHVAISCVRVLDTLTLCWRASVAQGRSDG
jgi:hypothetical protein